VCTDPTGRAHFGYVGRVESSIFLKRGLGTILLLRITENKGFDKCIYLICLMRNNCSIRGNNISPIE
jgi:hypothetical protein